MKPIAYMKYLVAIIALMAMANVWAQDAEMCQAYKSRWDLWSSGQVRGANVVLDIADNQTDWEILSEKWKLNSVRLQIVLPDDKLAQMASTGFIKFPDFKKRLHAFYRNAQAHKIGVVLDIHRAEGGSTGKGKFWSTPKFKDNFSAVLVTFVKEFGSYDNFLGLDLLNEPTPESVYTKSYDQRKNTQDDWMAVADRLITDIRKYNPCLPIVVESVDWAKPFRFKEMRVFEDPYVVYSAHMYAPFEVTHQGINQFKKGGTLAAMKLAGDELKKYLINNLKEVRTFQCKNKVPIYIGEFGINFFNEDAERSAYIADLMNLYTRYNWSWSYHAYGIWRGWMPNDDMLASITQTREAPGARGECVE